MWIAISAVGTFYTADGGLSWQTRNQGVRADYLPDRYPEVGQCVHKLVMAPGYPPLLYQQNHCGVYRSKDGGEHWEEISRGLPSDFGFPIAVHPHDFQTIYVIPLDAEGGRVMPEGKAAVWRSRDGGETWQRQAAGL
ncbi:MAG: glycoside hydrolase, partial [Chloroflexota bacterium]